jgi:ATP-dependent DNA ligase
MLAAILRVPTRLDDPAYLAEPKPDGQRAQLHVAGGRAGHTFSPRAAHSSTTAGSPGTRRLLPVDRRARRP